MPPKEVWVLWPRTRSTARPYVAESELEAQECRAVTDTVARYVLAPKPKPRRGAKGKR